MKNNNNNRNLAEFVFVFIRARNDNIEVTMQMYQNQEYLEERIKYTGCPRISGTPTNVVPSYMNIVLKKKNAYFHNLNATTVSYHLPNMQVHLIKQLWSYDFRRKCKSETNFTTFCNCFACSHSITQQKNYKHGPASKFMFEVISWKLFYGNYSCFLLMIGK